MIKPLGVVARWGGHLGSLACARPPFPSAFTIRGQGHQAPGQRGCHHPWVLLPPAQHIPGQGSLLRGGLHPVPTGVRAAGGGCASELGGSRLAGAGGVPPVAPAAPAWCRC